MLDGKSRLSHSLGPQEKKKLILAMLKDVLAAVEESGLFSRVLVISPDRDVKAEASLPDGAFLHQEGSGLNAGIRQATLFAIREGASSVAVLLADIPLIEPRDLKELYSMGDRAQRAVLSPSLKGGTNVMIQAPPSIIAPSYGRWSFSNHLRAAQKAGLAVYSVSNQRLSFDVDLLGDLWSISEIDPSGRTHTARLLQDVTAVQAAARPSRGHATHS